MRAARASGGGCDVNGDTCAGAHPSRPPRPARRLSPQAASDRGRRQMDRPQREGRGKRGNASLAALREVHAGGKKRSEQYAAPDEAPIYEEVNDDHYKKIRQADDFVVDEGEPISS